MRYVWYVQDMGMVEAKNIEEAKKKVAEQVSEHAKNRHTKIMIAISPVDMEEIKEVGK